MSSLLSSHVDSSEDEDDLWCTSCCANRFSNVVDNPTIMAKTRNIVNTINSKLKSYYL